jgi:biopolymer transport protein ExbB
VVTLIQQGGAIMWLILAGGTVAGVVFLERLFHLHRAKIKADDFVKGICNILERRNIKEALGICEETPGPVARIVRTAIQHRELERGLLEQSVDQTALLEIALLERRLGVLAVVAQLAPLLGILGTVIGMIQTYWAIEQGAPLVQPANLAGGVWHALLTTAAGLGVAILSCAGYTMLVVRLDAIVMDMERSAGEIIGFLTSAAADPDQSGESSIN